MNDKILILLREKKAYVSGQEISKKLGISRSAIWKHIEELREGGYDIIAVPHHGYKLLSTPDRLLCDEIARGLHTKLIGRHIVCHDVVSSTMDIGMELALKGCHEGTVVCAEGQQKGRGRLGRSWSSTKHKGVYVSIVLRPKISPLESPQLTLMCAVSVCKAIRAITRLDCLIKWPNDLMVGNKKVGGILTEMNAELDAVKCIILGIGLNVNTPESFLPPHATSLKEQAGERISRLKLLQCLLTTLDQDYLLFSKEGFKPIKEQWKQLSATLGHRVKVFFHHSYIDGEAIDIDNDGALFVKKDSGAFERITSGDIVKIR